MIARTCQRLASAEPESGSSSLDTRTVILERERSTPHPRDLSLQRKAGTVKALMGFPIHPSGSPVRSSRVVTAAARSAHWAPAGARPRSLASHLTQGHALLAHCEQELRRYLRRAESGRRPVSRDQRRRASIRRRLVRYRPGQAHRSTHYARPETSPATGPPVPNVLRTPKRPQISAILCRESVPGGRIRGVSATRVRFSCRRGSCSRETLRS